MLFKFIKILDDVRDFTSRPGPHYPAPQQIKKYIEFHGFTFFMRNPNCLQK